MALHLLLSFGRLVGANGLHDPLMLGSGFLHAALQREHAELKLMPLIVS